MRTLVTTALGAVALSLLGCSQGASTNPSPNSLPAATNAESHGAIYVAGDRAQSLGGRFEVSIDPSTLSGTVSLRDDRTVMANDDVYDLSIANFTRRDTLKIMGISRSATTLDIDYVVTHPFAAPTNLAGPATAANRADLGVSGRVCFMLDVPSATGNTYFTTAATAAPGVNGIVANTGTVANAHGYYAPAGLIPGLTTTANTFPYRVLVDEEGPDGARVGVSNGGIATGNYIAAIGGWQQENIGPTNDGWTGFGVLQQGQAASSRLSLNLSALSGPVDFDAVILVTYNDPRVGLNAATKRANRLPKAPTDINAFAYRMPHGALDVERMTFYGESGGFIPNTISSSTLNFGLVDWDARATETSEIDLAGDPVLSNVALGESGPPQLAVDIPAITGGTPIEFDNGTDLLDDDTAFGGDAGQDLGTPGDALYYSKSITNSVGSGQTPGAATGLAMAIDPEILSANDWHFYLDPDLGLASPAPAPVAFQAFTVNLGPLNAQPVANFALASTTVLDGGTVTVQATAYSDAELDPIEVRIDWNNDLDFADAGETGNMLAGAGGPQVNFTSPITYTWSMSNPDNRQIRVQFTDNISAAVNAPNLNFTVIENTSTCGAPWTSPATFATVWSGVTGDYTGLSFADSPSNQVEYDYAAFPVPTFNTPAPNTNAGWLAQRITSIPSYQIHRIYALGATHTAGLGELLLTNAPATLGNSLATARQVHQIEVDRLNRVFFARRDVGLVSTGLIGPTNGATANGFYLTGSPGIVWFDTDGGATLATDANMNTIATTNRVVALAVGFNDDLLMIDNQNILHRYPKVTNYTEDTSAPFPINLAAGPYNIAVGTQYVHDFVQSRYNGAMFIVTEDTAGIDRIYRIECDGTLTNPIPSTANPNPLVLQVGDWTALTRPHDISIDEVNSTGNLIGAPGDAQIVLSGYMSNAANHGHDIQVITTRLEKTAGGNNGVIYLNSVNTQNNWLITRQGSGTRSFRLSGVPPAGWQ